VVASNSACPGQVCCRQKDYWQFVKDIRWLSPGSAHHLEKVGSGGVALCAWWGGERGWPHWGDSSALEAEAAACLCTSHVLGAQHGLG